ncbi:MAG: TraM recognition domain-containing protein, partial [Patescibacteria group bacterium]
MLTKDNQLVVLGETNFRNQRWRFGIKTDDRRRHMYVVGSTGMGKSEFLKNMAIQDMEMGHGLAYIDPHGDAADALLGFVPTERIKDVIYFDPGDLSYPIAFNVMEKVGYEYRHLVASGLSGVFKKIFGIEVWSGRMEYILNNTILALLEYPGATLLGINKMLSNKEYRNKIVANVKDPIVRSFWVDEFAKYTDRYMQEATPAIQNKIGQFIANNLVRNVIGQIHSTIDVRKIMDEGKILIVNLSRGKIGEDASRLLGALLVTKIQLAAMSRVDIAEKDRRDFYLYVDEFQNFATESFANILSEARKYHLSLIVAHQYIKQMEEPVMDAVFGNVGTIISFRVGADDGEFLEKWFQPDFLMNDIVNLGKFNIYLKLMIDGVSSRGFSAQTIPPFPKLEHSNREAVIEFSRKTYATPRETVEKSIAEWAGSTQTDEAPSAKGRSFD